MKRISWQEKLVGSKLPLALAKIEWQNVGEGEQQVGWDTMNNEWRREKNTRSYWDEKSKEPKLITETIPGFKMWTTLMSEYRKAVNLPVFITVDEEGKIEDIEIDAFVSYGPCHGRPGYTTAQQREEHQIGRLLKALLRDR